MTTTKTAFCCLAEAMAAGIAPSNQIIFYDLQYYQATIQRWNAELHLCCVEGTSAVNLNRPGHIMKVTKTKLNDFRFIACQNKRSYEIVYSIAMSHPCGRGIQNWLIPNGIRSLTSTPWIPGIKTAQKYS